MANGTKIRVGRVKMETNFVRCRGEGNENHGDKFCVRVTFSCAIRVQKKMALRTLIQTHRYY